MVALVSLGEARTIAALAELIELQLRGSALAEIRLTEHADQIAEAKRLVRAANSAPPPTPTGNYCSLHDAVYFQFCAACESRWGR